MHVSLLFALSAAAAPAFARDCPCEADRVELRAFRDRVAAAPTPDDARELALSKTRLGHRAIRQVGRLAPHDAGVVEADRRLSRFEAGVAASPTQEEVALRFDELLLSSGGHCQYTPLEVGIVVVGFLLGILPGIILLFVFC